MAHFELPYNFTFSGLDFAVINEVVDLYEIDTNCLNYCSSELRTGIAPINGEAEYTLVLQRKNIMVILLKLIRFIF